MKIETIIKQDIENRTMNEAKMTRPVLKSGYSMKSVTFRAVIFFLFLTLPGTFAWAVKGGGNAKWAQNEVLYKLQDPAGVEQINLIKNELDADIDEVIAEIGFDTIRRLRSRSKSTEELMQRLKQNPHVLYAEPNYIITDDRIPDDSSYGSQWGMPFISAPLAWDITTGTGVVVVGLVDSGTDYNHPDLSANIWSNPGVINGCPSGTHGFDVVQNTCNPMDSGDNGHGTLVSGIIGAVGNNGTGVAGVNWSTGIMGLKFKDPNTGYGDIADAIAAIAWAVTAKQAGVNIRVLNISWGYEGEPSQAFLDEINEAGNWDILIVASAGNNSVNIDTTPHYPASYGASNEIGVAATTIKDGLSSFSSYGVNSVNLGAPGSSILSTYPNNTYSTTSGTSFAAAHVSGAAALILSVCSQLTVNGLKSLILNNVDPLPSLAGKVSTGGRLNVYKAIQNCSGSVSPSIPHTNWSLWYADSEETVGEDGAAENAFDDSLASFWHTQWSGGSPSPPHEIQIDLGGSYSIDGFRYFPRQDGGVNGTIAGYEFYVSTDGSTWGSPVATGVFASNTAEKEVLFPATTGRYIRLRALSEINGNPWTSMAEINVLGSVSSGNQAPNGVIDTPSSNVTINAGGSVSFSGTGNDPDGNLPLSFRWSFGAGSGIADATVEDPGAKTFTNVGVYTVTFTVTDALGMADPYPDTRVITVQSGGSSGTPIPKTNWSLWYVDSEETVREDGVAENAFDDSSASIWHTQYNGGSPPPPHEIQIDLGGNYSIDGLRYLPRQDGGINGTIAQYQFYVSADGINWGTAVAAGTFANNTAEKEVRFAAVAGRYVRLLALTEVNGNRWTSAAEIGVLGTSTAASP